VEKDFKRAIENCVTEERFERINGEFKKILRICKDLDKERVKD
jgi:hypothetical protein